MTNNTDNRKFNVDQNQDKMTDTRLNEALSALMDGEVDELELRRILRELPARPELSAAWSRYHAVRASLNREAHANPRVDLLAGVQARLAAEKPHAEFSPPARRTSMLQSRLMRYAGQGAIAASVAVAALMGVSFFETSDGLSDGATAPAIAAASPALNGEFNASEQTRTVSFDADAYDRLQQAVYRELSERPQAIPVSYNPEFPAEL
ncbi:MAG TPA: sigma-E factor negative regulatory protein, partial [Pseudomonadales bacterium]